MGTTKKQVLIPAPVDNKNIMTDWIDYVFDDGQRVWGGKHDEKVTGFIYNEPVWAEIFDHQIHWHLTEYSETFLEILKDVIEGAVKSDDDIEVKVYIDRWSKSVRQLFYFKETES